MGTRRLRGGSGGGSSRLVRCYHRCRVGLLHLGARGRRGEHLGGVRLLLVCGYRLVCGSWLDQDTGDGGRDHVRPNPPPRRLATCRPPRLNR